MTAPARSAFDPSQHPALTDIQASHVRQITEFTSQYFQNPKFDSSHDFNHVMRVVSNALYILKEEQNQQWTKEPAEGNLDAFLVILGALLHDVDDRKYIDVNSSNGQPLAKQELLKLGLTVTEAEKIQKLIDGVSYSSEIKDPILTACLVKEIPELAIVQDADRLDAIGAIGVARCFTFGGAKRARTLQHSVDHFTDKLLKLELMMKTETGKRLAAERTSRLRQYLEWWQDEISVYDH